MVGQASPIDIATSRQNSSSPRNQQSNLTSQLQRPQIDIHPSSTAVSGDDEPAVPERNRQESVSMLGTTPYGARQIPMANNQRRESYGVSGSLMNGMSWGGISMGSFIRDDILMAGTSPYQFQSPSFHSSSYLPKMEANYMRDYVCCDIQLDSMHELLQHYEEAHAAQPTQTMGRTPKDQQFPSTRAANANSTAQAVQQQAQNQPVSIMPQSAMNIPPPLPNPLSPLFSGQSHDQIGTFDNLDDMDMDDGSTAPQVQPIQGTQFQPQPRFGRQQPRGPSVNVNLAQAFQGHGLNAATPTTPHAHQQGIHAFPNNPTVSSVNTPTLSTQSTHRTATPDPSQPSTPAELDPEFLAQMNNLSNIDYSQLASGAFDFNGLGNINNHGGSATIDNPDKRLLNKQGQGSKGFVAGSAFAKTSDLSKQVRETQLLNGLAGAGGFVGEEIKPFKCPVIGCEKAYKNQNGLKYHKQHGHQNQQLKENNDGTFSIVDPTTSIPYPGTTGMEKEKPYRCEVCGKRYKNLNGLKYHRQHSPACNPEMKLDGANMSGIAGNLQNLSANVAGAGLLGMNEGIGY